MLRPGNGHRHRREDRRPTTMASALLDQQTRETSLPQRTSETTTPKSWAGWIPLTPRPIGLEIARNNAGRAARAVPEWPATLDAPGT